LQSGAFLGPHQQVFRPRNFVPVAGIMRDRFDYAFTMAAADAGAEVIDSNPVTRIKEQQDRVVVHTRQGVFEGSFLIGADGATGITKKVLKLGSRRPPAVALEVEIRRVKPLPFEGDTFVVHLGLIRDGYSWIFSKGHTHSVGIASLGRDRRRVKDKLAEWAHACGYGLAGEVIHGHPIPVWTGRAPLATRRSLVVGDAAATVDPLGGEGIRYAILSGRLAAQAVSQGLATGSLTADYTEAVHQAIQADFVYARWLAVLVYRFPGFFFHLWVRTQLGADLSGKVLCGELRYRDLLRKALQTLLKPRAYRRLFVHPPSQTVMSDES